MAPRRTRHEIGPVEPTAAAACQAHAGMVSAIMGGELKTLGTGSPSDESLAAQLNINDPQIVAIMSNMPAEATAGCPSGSLYGECVSLTLAAAVGWDPECEGTSGSFF